VLLQLDRLGVHTVFIGNGAADFIDEFIVRHNLRDKRFTIVTDPSLASFSAAGLKRSRWATMGAPGMFGMARAWGRGFKPYKGPGDDWQQGGALFMDGDNLVRHYFRSRFVGDVADANELVSVAMGLAAAKIEPAKGHV